MNGAIISNNENPVQPTDILLFPNPTSNQLTLSNLPLDIEKIIVVDAYGQTIFYQNSLHSTTVNISLDNLANRLYFVIIEGKNIRETEKFVKP